MSPNFFSSSCMPDWNGGWDPSSPGGARGSDKNLQMIQRLSGCMLTVGIVAKTQFFNLDFSKITLMMRKYVFFNDEFPVFLFNIKWFFQFAIVFVREANPLFFTFDYLIELTNFQYRPSSIQRLETHSSGEFWSNCNCCCNKIPTTPLVKLKPYIGMLPLPGISGSQWRFGGILYKKMTTYEY